MNIFNEIILEFKKHTPIPKEKIIEWMQNGDIETMGALYSLIFDRVHIKRIVPPLRNEEYFDFIVRYFAYCLVENPESEWADNRYEAGWNLIYWFNKYWKENKSYAVKLKKWLSEIYLTGNKEIKDCIAVALLEHLFENEELASFFEDWANIDNLREVYSYAIKSSKYFRSKRTH